MFEATDENDLEIAMMDFCGRTVEHILTMLKMSGVLASVHIMG